MLDERIVEIETKLVFQDDTLDALNKIVTEQQERINQLEAACKYLNERLVELQTPTGQMPAQETPPHY